MLRLVLAGICFLILSCSSTDVADNSDVAATVLTLGANKVNEAYNEYQGLPSDKFKRVYAKIIGQIIISEKCYFSYMNHSVELVKENSKKPDLFGVVNRDMLTYSLSGRISKGDYILNLISSRDSKIIESKKLRIDSQHDNFTVNFNGCL